MKKFALLLPAIGLMFLTQNSFAFTAVTAPAVVQNFDPGSDGATVGDSFLISNGTFASYAPGLGDPVILFNDLDQYLYNMSGTVISVVGGLVTYSGLYEIAYDVQPNGVIDQPLDFSYSSGTLTMTIDFSTGGTVFAANGTLHQTAGPEVGFPSTGFAGTDAIFTGTYTANPLNPLQGTVQGTVQSVPDAGSTLALLGVAFVGIAGLRRKFNA